MGIQYTLPVGAELLALGKYRVELVLAEHSAACCLRQHFGNWKEVLDLDSTSLGVDVVEVERRVGRFVVVGDHVLARYFDDLDAQIDGCHFPGSAG